MAIFKTRADAADYLVAKGIKITSQTLADKATDGTGPRYAIINGRALYTESDLDGWVANQVAAASPRAQRASRHVAA